MIKTLLSLLIILTAGVLLPGPVSAEGAWWSVRSIDTMKYSRDVARQYLTDPAFDAVIDRQVKDIAAAGATHVAIATPYDEEFLPFLQRWVSAARKYQLKVWFRGNWSGWAHWFGYPSITGAEHLAKTSRFITSHPDLFADGDIFSPCHECENGGPGDPRLTGDVAAYRQFLIDEYHSDTRAFQKINKQVAANYNSMNADVARLIMDRDTTRELGGLVTIDHYVRTPDRLVSDIRKLAQVSGGQIVLGEFGAPVPDIHGSLTPQAQSQWVGEALNQLIRTPEVVAVNYWTSYGGSTRLFEEDTPPRPVVAVLTSYFQPRQIAVSVTSAAGQRLRTASASYFGKAFAANSQGIIYLPAASGAHLATVSAPGYLDHGLQVGDQDTAFQVELTKIHENWLFKLQKLTYRILSDILQAIK